MQTSPGISRIEFSAGPLCSSAPLIDTTKGDIVYLTQLEGSSMSTSDGPVPVRALTKSAVLAPLTLAIGPAKALTATFTEPPTVTAKILWRRADYWQLGSSVTPSYRIDTAYDALNISVPPCQGTPNSRSRGWSGEARRRAPTQPPSPLGPRCLWL